MLRENSRRFAPRRAYNKGQNERKGGQAMGRRTGILESGRVLYLPLGSIRPNPAQPRRVFDPAGLQELADSIREYGILQPLTVRRRANGYELIAGTVSGGVGGRGGVRYAGAGGEFAAARP